MAFAWTEMKIEVADRERKLANVTGTIADGADVRTFTMPGFNANAKPDRPLAAILQEAVAGLMARYEADAAARAAQTALGTTLAGWEASLLTACNAALET